MYMDLLYSKVSKIKLVSLLDDNYLSDSYNCISQIGNMEIYKTNHNNNTIKSCRNFSTTRVKLRICFDETND